MDSVGSLAEVISNRFISQVFNIRKCLFFEAGANSASTFTGAELSARDRDRETDKQT